MTPQTFVVSDTSAISSLLQIGEIEILRQLYGQILIPEAVRTELKRSHAQIPGFIQTESVSPSPALQARLKTRDIGEAYAITLAEQIHADLLLIDEKKGRAAQAFNTWGLPARSSKPSEKEFYPAWPTFLNT